MAITKLVISGADSKTISLAHKAEATSVVPDDNITATNVQSALEQLDDIKAPKASPTFTGTVTASSLAVDTDTLFVDATNNRVGINKTNATFTLDVAGNTRTNHLVLNAVESAPNEASFIYKPSTYAIAFGTATEERMRIDQSGFVGIGEINPSKKLHIKDGDVRIESAFPRVFLTDTNSDSDYSIINNNGKFGIYDDTNATYRLVVNSTGELGIGTDSPDGILHAQKANAGADTAIMIENSGQSGTSTASLIFTGNGGAGQEKARIKSAVYGDGFMDFHTNNDSFAMRIDSSGHVLVGTLSSTGDATNVKKVVGGVFTTLRDSVSVANNTATTVATLPSGEGNYMVSASLDNSNNPAHYNETAMVGVSQSSSAISVLKNASHLSLSMSGLDLQVTHNQGATQTIHFSILRIL